MMGEEQHPGTHEIPFLGIGGLSGYSGAQPPAGLNSYLARAIDTDLVEGQSLGAFVYAKLGPALFAGFVNLPRSKWQWRGTKLHVNNGAISNAVMLPGNLATYIEGRVSKVAEITQSLSDRQRTRIAVAYRQDPERVRASETMRALRADIDLFGRGLTLERPINGDAAET